MKINLKIFHNRNVLFYWMAVWASALGDAILILAISWFIVETTDSGVILGTFMMCMGMARIIFMVIGGVYVDRFPPLMIMKISLLIRAGILSYLMYVMVSEMEFAIGLYIGAIVFGMVDAFFLPAAAAIRQRLVSSEHFSQLNSLLLVATQTSVMVGPLLGSFLIRKGDYLMTVGAVIALFLIAMVMLQAVILHQSLDMKKENLKRSNHSKGAFFNELVEGFRYIVNTPIILTMMIVAMLVNAGVSVLTVALPFLAQHFGSGAEGLSMMNAAMGFGGAIGAVVFTLWTIKMPTPQMNLTASFIEGSALFFIALTPNLWGVGLLLGVIGFTTTAINVIAPSVNQSIIPKPLMGRVVSVMMVVMTGLTPFAQSFAGYLTEKMSTHHGLMYGGALELFASGLAFFIPAVRNYSAHYVKKRINQRG
ncbi:MFS transporter [Marininema halotolerans]|uniref:Predicted arabinose efflux permease, MFS family n=1 Tax=Marininema halotolerans TaxID=1155944 RepID=A0A1I6P7K2_9BACL|nr:MFS transporter [Marininema halotolerans]SFS36167.1 Predicted arabinose efflux permease, MFS family [Marininema halotolerans]